MIFKVQAAVYSWMRDSAGLTQRQLAKATGIARRTIQRIERCRRPPTREEEALIVEATASSPLLIGELMCKALSEELGRRVSMSADDPRDYRPATPDGEAHELLRSYREWMPRDLWWSLMERLSRVDALGLWVQHERLAIVRDLRVLGRELDREETAEETQRSPPAEQLSS